MKGEDHAADCNVESLELDLFEFLQWFVFFKKKTIQVKIHSSKVTSSFAFTTGFGNK